MPHDFSTTTAGPQRVSATRSHAAVGDNRLPGSQPHRFVLAHHPASWEYTDHGFLPKVTRHWLRPGCNGVTKGANGHQRYLSRLRGAGWIILDDDMPVPITAPDGTAATAEGYMFRYEGQTGPHYADAWSAPSIVGAGRGRRVDWSATYDRGGYDAWRVTLRDNGIVPPPTAGTLAELCKMQSHKANRRIAEAHDGNPHVQASVRNHQDKLKAMRAAATQAANPPQKPQKARKATTTGGG